MASNSKVIITCAVTGAIHTPSMSKALPVTPQEIADAAVEAAEAGAAIVHLHARNPKTGQPDFGTIIITYVPAATCIELKSLKLYLFEFRNRGIFYEHAINTILDDLVAACQPRRMRVVGQFTPRGGISTRVSATHEATARTI